MPIDDHLPPKFFATPNHFRNWLAKNMTAPRSCGLAFTARRPAAPASRGRNQSMKRSASAGSTALEKGRSRELQDPFHSAARQECLERGEHWPRRGSCRGKSNAQCRPRRLRSARRTKLSQVFLREPRHGETIPSRRTPVPPALCRVEIFPGPASRLSPPGVLVDHQREAPRNSPSPSPTPHRSLTSETPNLELRSSPAARSSRP